jgi:hypothetical protein
MSGLFLLVQARIQRAFSRFKKIMLKLTLAGKVTTSISQKWLSEAKLRVENQNFRYFDAIFALLELFLAIFRGNTK